MKEVKFASDTKSEDQDEELSPEKAAQLYEEGGFYIVKDLPVGTEFGCDMKSWNTGAKFLGLKMIPKGIHYIHYSPVSKDKDVAPRRGFFIHLDAKQVIVHRFDVKSEEIVDDVPYEDVERLESNLKTIDGHLGAYPHQSWSKWVCLTNRLDIAAVRSYQTPLGDNSLDVEHKFTEVPRQKYPDGASAAEITAHSLDSSHQLDTWLRAAGHDAVEAVLAELQLAFVLFLVGQDHDSFSQWKLVVDMLCGCRRALLKYPAFFKSFINDLHFQVKDIK